jgi:hypothetical protein
MSAVVILFALFAPCSSPSAWAQHHTVNVGNVGGNLVASPNPSTGVVGDSWAFCVNTNVQQLPTCSNPNHMRITLTSSPFSEGNGPFPTPGLGDCTNDLHTVSGGTFQYLAEIRTSGGGGTCASFSGTLQVGDSIPALGAAGLAGLFAALAIAGGAIVRGRSRRI